MLMRIAAGWLLFTCWTTGWILADDAPLGPQPAVQKAESPARGTEVDRNPGPTDDLRDESGEAAKFEDTAVATLNHKDDAAAQARPTGASTSPAAAAITPVTAPAAPQAQTAVDESSGPPAVIDTDRKSRLAALKARLHQHMGADADPPAEESPPGPPPGPVIGLRQPQFLQDRRISISGWLEQGITVNGNHPASGFNGPVASNDLDGEYQMNQFWMTLERPVDTAGGGFDFGGRIDAAYGTDWRWYMNNGLENRLNGPTGQTYGTVLPQAYAAVGYNDLKVKLGTFEAPMDYESMPAPANFFYSHSYCYTYGVPHLLTGMLADFRMDENWSVQGGLHRGWSEFAADNPAVDFLGGFRWQSSDRRTMVSYTLSTGPQDVGSTENGFVYSLVIQEKLGPRSQYVLVHDLGVETNGATDNGTADWYGLNQYYIYWLNNECAACVRAEWFRDQDGMLVSGPGNMTDVRAWSGHGFAGNFYELTAGLNWRPQANVLFRPEIRYDWYDGGSGAYGLSNQKGLPFNDGRSSSQFLTAADLILTF